MGGVSYLSEMVTSMMCDRLVFHITSVLYMYFILAQFSNETEITSHRLRSYPVDQMYQWSYLNIYLSKCDQ